MLYPAIHDLKKHVDSSYMIVTQAARRARELQEHPDSALNESYHSYKPVGKALEELSQGKLNISK